MSRRKHLLLALALSVSVAPACEEAGEADFSDADDIEFRPGFGHSGLLLNTNAIGDHPLHEFSRYGTLYGDVKLEGVYIRVPVGKLFTWVKLQEVWVDHGEIFGKIDDNSPVLRNKDMENTRWRFYTLGGGLQNRELFLVKHRFDKEKWLHLYTFGYPNNPEYGMHYYTGKKQEIPNSSYLATCANEGGNLEAVVYEDLHVDMHHGSGKKVEGLINLACLSGAVGKAALWGYKSYDMGVENFIAGVRTIRADYCGDGDSWTKPGTAIDLQDVWSINKFTDPNFKTEALWNHKGAVCLTNPRRPEFSPGDIICNNKKIPNCENADFGNYPGSRLWTKTPG